MYFWTCGLRKTWLDKCLKSSVSEDPLTSNTVNGPKHCLNLNDSDFTVFIDPSGSNSGWKNLSETYVKMLGLFIDPLTAGEKYSVLNRDNLLHDFQRQLSKETKTFSPFSFLFFVNLHLFLNLFKKK